MRNIVAFPLIGLIVILQSSIVSQVKLLSGYADLPLIVLAAWALQERVKSTWHWAVIVCVMVGFISHLPWPVYVLGYLGVVLIAQVLQRRIWQAPLLAMFSITFAGTLLMHILSFLVLRILGTPFSFGDVVGLISLPSLLLNMLFAIPIYAVMRDLARWVYPSEEYE
jgi:rod shape-determining protein MreD